MAASLLSLQQRIVTVVCLLLILGQIMLFSATGVMGATHRGSEFYYVFRQAIGATIGLAVMFFLSRVRYQVWAKLAIPAILLQIALVALTVFTPLGHHAQGSSRWLRLGPLQFQPSELAKITLSIYASYVIASANKARPSYWITHTAILIVLLALVFRQPDLGSTVLLASVVLGLLFVAGARLMYLFAVIGPGVAIALFAMLNTEYRRRRVMAFLNPWADPQGSGFQTIQSFLSFYSGKLFGVGIGNGNSKLFFLPEVHTDFIFSLIGEELGFAGAIAVLFLFGYLGFLLLKAATRAPDAFGRYLGYALSLSLLLQIAVNLGGVTGLIPVKGLPLPFISWGRSALIVNLAMIGILLNVVRQSGSLK